MTAANLLTQARADGLTLRLDPPDRLKLAGAPTAVAKWAPILRPHKPELVRLLADHQAAVKEAQAERAAIAEYLGGLPRGRAEAVAELAGAFYSHHWICPICRHGTQPGAGLHSPCPEGARLWDRYCQAAGREVRP